MYAQDAWSVHSHDMTDHVYRTFCLQCSQYIMTMKTITILVIVMGCNICALNCHKKVSLHIQNSRAIGDGADSCSNASQHNITIGLYNNLA